MKRLVDAFGMAIGFALLAVPALAGAPAPVPTPEPASMALLAAGIGGAAWAKFRKRK